MAAPTLYPLGFEPLFQARPWGGRRLEAWMDVVLPGDGPIGEAWLLSDRDGMANRVAAGPLKGSTLAQLIAAGPAAMLGALAGRFTRFPILIKYLDVAGMLSAQVHPQDGRADLIPPGDTGKTEAWVVLEARPGSRIYAGLKPGVSLDDLGHLSMSTVDTCLASFTPQADQTVLINAGVVHAIGDGLLVLEMQENSDVTFRLFDWDRVDPATGRRRDLQIRQALACVDMDQGAIHPGTQATPDAAISTPGPLLACAHFRAWRRRGAATFVVGETDQPRVLVCVEGEGAVHYQGASFPMAHGSLILLPAAVGACEFVPLGAATVLEIAAPEPA